MKRKDECLFCSRRKCYARVFSLEPGRKYDEIACIEHIQELHTHSDKAVPGVLRRFISGSKQTRHAAY
jgi:hypothetical protein